MAGGTTGSRHDAGHGWPTPSKSGPRSPAPVPQVHWALGCCLNGLFQGVENLDRPPYRGGEGVNDFWSFMPCGRGPRVGGPLPHDFAL